jgi:hypothetical protein
MLFSALTSNQYSKNGRVVLAWAMREPDIRKAPVRAKLTDHVIRKAPVGAKFTDHVVTELKLHVRKTVRTFCVYYNFKGQKQRWLRIGDWPTFSLAQARKIAKKKLFEVASGIDPQAERIAARTAPTVADMCDRYWDEVASSQKSASEVERIIRLHIKPKLGRERVDDLTYTMVYEWHRSIGRVRSNRALARLSVMLTFAEKWDWRPANSNPCRLVKRVPEKRRERYMTDDEAVLIKAR